MPVLLIQPDKSSHLFVVLLLCSCLPSFHFLFSVDMWSVGCIMGEMIKGAVLFPGTDRILPRLWASLVNIVVLIETSDLE